MTAAIDPKHEQTQPPRRKRHYSFDEDVYEPDGLIEDEPTDVEAAVPEDGNEPVERAEKDDPSALPAFEE
jgi:hypothetical protein